MWALALQYADRNAKLICSNRCKSSPYLFWKYRYWTFALPQWRSVKKTECHACERPKSGPPISKQGWLPLTPPQRYHSTQLSALSPFSTAVIFDFINYVSDKHGLPAGSSPQPGRCQQPAPNQEGLQGWGLTNSGIGPRKDPSPDPSGRPAASPLSPRRRRYLPPPLSPRSRHSRSRAPMTPSRRAPLGQSERSVRRAIGGARAALA